MNKTLATIVATFAMASISSAGLAADSTKTAVPESPVISAPAPAVDAAAKRKAKKLQERNKKAKVLSGSAHKATPPAADAAAKKVDKLQDRNMKALENTKALTPKEAPAVPAAK